MKPRPTFRPVVLAFVALSVLSGPTAFGDENEPPGDKTGGKKEPPRTAPPQKKEESAKECVKHSIEARYVSGYDHLVHLSNECSRGASCKVSTDVNPEIQNVHIASGKKASVLTFRGSPARTFQAHVECALDG